MAYILDVIILYYSKKFDMLLFLQYSSVKHISHVIKSEKV